uniref:Ubiquitin carboxyl-terminal hydrolase n=2 Tax=Chrysemys picta bellii TaxID=8478 RepID=A0A8C3HSM5_CHRPI
WLGERWFMIQKHFFCCNFLKQLGIHPDWQFVDVYGMDPELLSMVPRPVCAVLLLFPVTEKYETFRTEEEERIKAQGQNVRSSVYFMKQTINNACGTIGLIHAIANNRDKMNFESDSTLKKFLEDSLPMSPEERAKYLETYEVSIFFILFFSPLFNIVELLAGIVLHLSPDPANTDVLK